MDSKTDSLYRYNKLLRLPRLKIAAPLKTSELYRADRRSISPMFFCGACICKPTPTILCNLLTGRPVSFVPYRSHDCVL